MGILRPSDCAGSAGQEMKVVETCGARLLSAPLPSHAQTGRTLAPMISSTELWRSASVSRLMCPFCTCCSHMPSGLEPME